MPEDCRSETIKKCEDALEAAERAGEMLGVYCCRRASGTARECGPPFTTRRGRPASP
ncbi:hypothetical protein MHY1_02960 [Methylovirgula sp. HY1]|nr:hypothetical protein MHY1_02960 [Methylovirgula sp. HY1]